MKELPNDQPRAPAGAGWVRVEPVIDYRVGADVECRDAEAAGSIDLERLARHLATRCEALERRHAHLVAGIRRLERRLRQVESRLATLIDHAADQQESTRMICAILKDLDDPYGFGLSLDERLARDESDATMNDET